MTHSVVARPERTCRLPSFRSVSRRRKSVIYLLSRSLSLSNTLLSLRCIYVVRAQVYGCVRLDTCTDLLACPSVCLWSLPAFSHGPGDSAYSPLISSSACVFSFFFVWLFFDVQIHTAFRVWDSLVLEGHKVLFRVALAIFRLYEAELAGITDLEDLMTFSRWMTRRLVRIEEATSLPLATQQKNLLLLLLFQTSVFLPPTPVN